MPNHVTNILYLPGQSDLLDRMLNYHGLFDFNNFIKMPEELANSRAASFTKTIDECEDQVIASLMVGDEDRVLLELERKQMINKYGYPSWYEWAIAHWGTKWNAYEQERVADDAVLFLTAWDTPRGVWEALAKKFPEAKGNVVFVEEFDQFAGKVLIEEGDAKLLMVTSDLDEIAKLKREISEELSAELSL